MILHIACSACSNSFNSFQVSKEGVDSSSGCLLSLWYSELM